MQLRAKVFEVLGALSARLPRIRGKNRAVLGVHRALGLQDRHVFVDARLKEPVAYRARLDLHSWLQRLAFVSGGYEAETVRFLARLQASSPGYLVDIGANIGLIAVPFAMLSQSRVVALEAVPDNVEALRGTIAMNAVDPLVRVLPLAVGDAAGSVDIQVEGDLKSGGGTGTANILPAGSDYACERQRIEVSTLDALYGAGELPRGAGVVKIDTDGYDLKVLQGAATFIAAERPVVFGEFMAHCLNWHGQGIADVRAWADTAGYELWFHLPGSQLRFARALEQEFVQDLLLVPLEKTAALAWCLDERG